MATHSPVVLGQQENGSSGEATFRSFHDEFTHTQNPNDRRRLALAEIDKAPFGWYHIRACVVAGTGFFTSSYDIFAINMVTGMLGVAFWQNPRDQGIIPSSADTAIKAAAFGGIVLGQLVFGWLADLVGRQKMYGLELILIIFATLTQALSSPSPATSIVGHLVFWRVLMGIGLGGDFPLTSIITSEYATVKWRGAMMNGVFAMQGFGQLAAALVALFVTIGFKDSIITASDASNCTGACQIAADKMWRIVIGIGIIPGCIALYARLTIPETPRYTFDVARDVEKAGEDVDAYLKGKRKGHPDEIIQATALAETSKKLGVPKASWSDFWGHYSQWRYGKILFGTAASWFFLDIGYFGLNLNNTIILSTIGYAGGSSMYEIFYRSAVGNLILSCAGAIPGFLVSTATIDILGRKPIQLMGFAILTILFTIIGFAYHHLPAHGLFALYVLSQFFFNFGPNSTTFIVPGECFPTRYRATSYGLAAASGKIGAIISQVVFVPLRTHGAKPGATGADASPFLNRVMLVLAFFMLLGFVSTFMIPETKRRSLEELVGEVPGTPNYDPKLDPNRKKEPRDGYLGWSGYL